MRFGRTTAAPPGRDVGGHHEPKQQQAHARRREARDVAMATVRVCNEVVAELVSKDTIIKFFVLDNAFQFYLTDIGVLKLKNHSKNLEVSLSSSSWELLSYTYRF